MIRPVPASPVPPTPPRAFARARRLALLGLLLLPVAACTHVRETGRRQLRLVPTSQETALGLSAWHDLLKDARVIEGTPEAEMVARVGRRIADASGASYAWEFRLLHDDDTVNAFCLPGGKIAVYSGLLAVTENEDGLAAVLGHEVAHATAHHAAERISQQLVASGVLDVVAVSLDDEDATTRTAVLLGLGIGAQVGVLLPYSRVHETEADEIGLRYLVRAGYNPHEAVRLWQRMEQREGRGLPAFLSTHPDPGARAERLARLIPRILAEERGAPAGP